MKAGSLKTVTQDAPALDGRAPIQDGLGLERVPPHDVCDGGASPQHPEDRLQRYYEKPGSDRDRRTHAHVQCQDEYG